MNLNRKHWNHFRYITLQKILWYATGRFMVEFVWDWWHVKVAKLPPYWSDADQLNCARRYCRYCGKGG